MNHLSPVVERAVAPVGWNTLTDKGKNRVAEEAALREICEQLYSFHALDGTHQPAPIRFYGPGPGGRVRPHDPPVGTLHFARWRHELATIEDSDGDGYYDEENPLVFNGQRCRPKYTTTGNQAAKEVNYFRWERITAWSMKDIKTFPGPGSTPQIYSEYLLNEDDFNAIDDNKPKMSFDLNNRMEEDPKDIYPLGYKLLKRWSKVNGYQEWEDGGCLGADPYNPDALTRHLGWFPKRLRMPKAGLGADLQDAVWNEVFHGNLDAKRKDKFFAPKNTWSEDPSKITALTSTSSPHNILQVLSFKALKAKLPRPGPDTLEARTVWLDARGARRPKYKSSRTATQRNINVNKLLAPSQAKAEGIADTKSASKAEGDKPAAEVAEPEKSTGPIQELKSISVEAARSETETMAWDAANRERQAIEATLEELSRNPEPGQEGKRPIVIYLAFRSRFLGMPVTQVVGYET
ncbi:hypothetical protein F5Y10DRAFT_290543 [Nemania abortiva]|nr:hypothetical protein F5Y10DRAFT_290543 [Nemania abortiva]